MPIEESRPHRGMCYRCFFPTAHCLCRDMQPFASEPAFTILIHPEERKKRIATARLAHLCMTNSQLYCGVDFGRHAPLNERLDDNHHETCVLYPTPGAIDIAAFAEQTRATGQQMHVIVPDGTWRTAKRIVEQSDNLRCLPRVSFRTEARSQFVVRKQPQSHCLSTLEAIYTVIDQLSPVTRAHERLLALQDTLVARQLSWELRNLGEEEFVARKPREAITRYNLQV